MRKQVSVARYVLLLLVVAMALTACKGQRAKVALGKSQEIMQQLEELQGDVHAPNDMKQIRDLIDQASSSLSSGANSDAFDYARRAKDLAETTLIKVEGDEARRLWNQAELDIQVADTNALSRTDPNRYRRIKELRDEGVLARDENDNRKVIRISREISSEVTTGISPMKNDADRERLAAEGKLQELKSAGGQNYDPESVINVTDIITRADQVAREQRDYVLAANQYREAITEAESGIENVQRLKGKEAIEKIEDLLATALEEGAQTYHPDDYTRVIDLLSSLVKDFEERRFTRVTLSSDELMPRAIALVEKTKRSAAEDRILQMRRKIQDFVDGGARDYLPGKIEILDDLLRSAREQRNIDTVDAFDKVREVFNEFQNEAQKIKVAFEDKANSAISVAANQLDTTEQVYKEAQAIFDASSGSVPSDMQPFEDSKTIRRTELEKDIEHARNSLVVAGDLMVGGKYRDSILTAQEQGVTAERILDDIYDLVSGNAVIELSSLISRYERDGARIFSPDELQRSKDNLEQVRSAREIKDYLGAVRLAAAARADIELMARRIAGRAVEDLKESRDLYDKIASARTQKYSADELEQAKKLLDQAEVDLQAERLKLALELAAQASQVTQEAVAKANRLAAEDAITSAGNKLSRAREAGAALYAGREIESARKLYDSSQALFANDDFVKAEELALSAGERADQAFYKKINDAEAAIADAKAVGGWEYDNNNLSKASAEVREARTLLESGSYDLSAQKANSSLAKAKSVARATKTNNYRTAFARIESNLDKGRDQGVNYFQVQDAIAVRQRLAELENTWSLERYDFVMAELNKLEGQLRGTLDSTNDVVDTVASQQTARLNHFVEVGASDYAAGLIDTARENLKYARVDYRNGLYKSAHSSLDKAIQAINEIESRHNQETYVDVIEELFQQYSNAQYRFRNVLSLDPTEMKALAFGSASRGNIIAIAGQATPSDFRSSVERLYSEVLYIQPPAGMEKVHQSVVHAFNEGRVAAIHFEKFIILNEASNAEAENLIDAAYEKVNSSNKTILDLKRQFFSDEVRFRLVSSSL